MGRNQLGVTTNAMLEASMSVDVLQLQRYQGCFRYNLRDDNPIQTTKEKSRPLARDLIPQNKVAVSEELKQLFELAGKTDDLA